MLHKKKTILVIILMAAVILLAGCTPNAMETTTTEDLKQGNIFKRYLVYPLSWSLDQFADLLFGSYGLSILIVTIIIRFIILPLSLKQYKSSKAMQKLQPEMEKIKKKYKDDPKKQQEETMKLFQSNNVNPLAGCFPLLIQMPVLFALYYAIVGNESIRTHSFLWMKLGEADPYYILPILAAITTWVQQKIMSMYTPMNPQMKTIMLIFPVLILVMSLNLVAAMPLYWFYGNVFMILQTYFIYGRSSTEEARPK